MKGLEWDVVFQPNESFLFQFGGTILQAELTENQPSGQAGEDIAVDFAGLDGDPIPNTPSLTLNASGEYSTPLTAELMGRARFDWGFVGQSRTEFRPNGPGADGFNPFTQTVGGYSLVNVRATVEGPMWTASVFISNLTDRRARVDAIASDQDPLALLTVRPRTFGFNMRYNF